MQLTEQEAIILTEARNVLENIQERAFQERTYHTGRLAEACERAEDCVFQVMNVAKSYCGDKTSAAYLHRANCETVRD